MNPHELQIGRAIGWLAGIAAAGAILGVASKASGLDGRGTYAAAGAIFALLLTRASRVLLHQEVFRVHAEITTVGTKQWDYLPAAPDRHGEPEGTVYDDTDPRSFT
jgi:hypothetical protein